MTPTSIRRWLESRGGRTVNDLHYDEKGLFVYMGNGNGGEMKVYLPEGLYDDR